MNEWRPSLPRRSPGAALRALSEDPERSPCRALKVPVERLREFSDEILRLHRVVPAVAGFIPMCSCGLPARCCDIIRAEHELLNIAMPFTFDPLRPSRREV